MQMNQLIRAALMMIMMGVFSSAFANQDSTPVGYWKTIDDVSGKPKSIVQIWKTDDEKLMGKVIKLFPAKGATPNKICSACAGDKRDQPIVGMVIMSGLKSNENQWIKGQILDPENGKTYSCSARLVANGKSLNVHGYLGLPLFGRSQTWERVDKLTG